MAIVYNAKGTSYPNFQIGKQGITIYQGAASPNNSNGNDGDLYVQNGNTQFLYQKVSGAWLLQQQANAHLNDIVGVTLANNSFLGSDGYNIVLRNQSDSRSALGLGTSALLNTGTSQGNVPILGTNGKLADSVIPALAINDFYTVTDLTARDALNSTYNIQNGDVAVVTSLSRNYIWTGSTWVLFTKPDAVTDVNGKVGHVSLSTDDLTSGTLGTGRGGTGYNIFNQGDLLLGNSSNTLTTLNIGTDKKVLQSNGTTASWQTLAGANVSYAPNTVQRLQSTNVQDAIDELAAEREFTYLASTAPGVNNDSVDTAAIGYKFKLGDSWINVNSQQVYFVVDVTPTAAVWIPVKLDSTQIPFTANTAAHISSGYVQSAILEVANEHSWINTSTSDPGVTSDGANYFKVGDIWVNTSSQKVWVCADNTTNAAVWHSINRLLEDTSPKLGGNLDVNSYSIISSSAGNININPNTTGLVQIGSGARILNFKKSSSGKLELYASGSEQDVSIEVRTQGAGTINLGSSGGRLLTIDAYTNTQIKLSAVGADSDISIIAIPKGNGVFEVNGIQFEQKRSFTVGNNVSPLSTFYSFDTTVVDSIIVDYSIKRLTSGNPAMRIGTMMIVTDGSTSVSYTDNSVDSADTGVTLSATLVSGIVSLQYVSSNLGTSYTGTMTYSVRRWKI